MENKSIEYPLQLRKEFNIPLAENVTLPVNNSIQPVYEVKKKICNIVRSSTATNSTSSTIYTTPSDKDFYLSSYVLTVIKDATATSISTRISVIIDGATQVLSRIDGITLTAQAHTITLGLPIPIRIDRSTNIVVTNTTAVANVIGAATIVGYTEEIK